MLYYFADGQKIAKNLSSQISKQSRTIQGLWKSSVCQFGANGITLPEALDPMLIGSRLQEFGISSATLAC